LGHRLGQIGKGDGWKVWRKVVKSEEQAAVGIGAAKVQRPQEPVEGASPPDGWSATSSTSWSSGSGRSTRTGLSARTSSAREFLPVYVRGTYAARTQNAGQEPGHEPATKGTEFPPKKLPISLTTISTKSSMDWRSTTCNGFWASSGLAPGGMPTGLAEMVKNEQQAGGHRRAAGAGSAGRGSGACGPRSVLYSSTWPNSSRYEMTRSLALR